MNTLNQNYLSLKNFSNPFISLDIPEPGIGTIEWTISTAQGEQLIRGEIKEKFFMVGLNPIDLNLFNTWIPNGPKGLVLMNGGKIPTGEFVITVSVALNSAPDKKVSASQSISLPKIPPIQLLEPSEDFVFKKDDVHFSWGMPQVEVEDKQFKLHILEAKGKKLLQPDLNDKNFVFEAPTNSILFKMPEGKKILDYDKHYMWYVALEVDGITYANSPLRYFYFDIVDEHSPKYLEKPT
ncbi:MAG: hypothetical protein IPK03_05070 [Bacteroidetes bacterium]|nr:hypothetical protein [Bacteroidota bacterium]